MRACLFSITGVLLNGSTLLSGMHPRFQGAMQPCRAMPCHAIPLHLAAQ